ncbi:MAG: double-strand break repair protein AddB [Pseudomonadota bacterium]
MFNASDQPQVFHVPLGHPFCEAFAAGLLTRVSHNPQLLAQTEIFVPTRRMATEIQSAIGMAGPSLLPRIKLISDLSFDPKFTNALPPERSAMERHMLLAQLIGKLSAQTGALASQTARFSLAASLDALLSEFQRAELPFEAIKSLDLSAYAQHWEVSQKFIGVLSTFLKEDHPRDAAARLRFAINQARQIWSSDPPRHPVLVVGSTGSREDTFAFMQAVSALPNGAIVLPGFDENLSSDVQGGLAEGDLPSDHPQAALAKTLAGLNVKTSQRWIDNTTAHPRQKLASLALTPAPVTNRWREEGPLLEPQLQVATKNISLLEAATPREEALAIALKLREALAAEVDAVLITPDRTLARQVTANLARWSIIPDDSAGTPLAQTPEGIFLRNLLTVIGDAPQTMDMISLLKHPLVFEHQDRGTHLLRLRNLEARFLRRGSPELDCDSVAAWLSDNNPSSVRWWDQIASWFAEAKLMSSGSLAHLAQQHMRLAERLHNGLGDIRFWETDPGREALAMFEDLIDASDAAGDLSLADYLSLIRQSFSGLTVREAGRADKRVAIWGTLEARNATRDLVILGGLNEGVWPQLPQPDPWLNRPMRTAIGLSSPERTVGLSAHDFQQALSAKHVVLSRSVRDGDAPTVASRWVLRLTNLLDGLGDEGKTCLRAMKDRAAPLLEWAGLLDQPTAYAPAATRPAPIPPVAARPGKLPVTQIQNLIRDPYAIYARYVLGLRKLDPLGRPPDILLRGSALHEVMEAFGMRSDKTVGALMETADRVLPAHAPWPISFQQWRARIAKVAHWLTAFEASLSSEAVVSLETEGEVRFSDIDFTLTAKPDRINRSDFGLRIIDYKTGLPPTDKVVKSFDKQLPLTKVIAERGGFFKLGAQSVDALTYVSLNGDSRNIDPEVVDLADTEANFKKLISAYKAEGIGFAARTRPKHITYQSDYDHLSRFGEWSDGDELDPETVK